MKIYIAVIGKMCAGKETVFNIITNEVAGIHSTAIHHSSDPLGEILNTLLLPKNRSNFQELSLILRQKFGEQVIGNVIKHRAELDPAGIVFFDGARRPDDIAAWRKLPNNYLLHVIAPAEMRFERLKHRANRPGDAEKTWEQFIEEDGAESESKIDEIALQADYTFANAGTLKDLRERIRAILKSIAGVKFPEENKDDTA